MEYAGILETIAEVAIALAGFGGIAAGLGYRAGGTWSESDQARLLGMALVSLSVVFACLLPAVLHYMGVGAVWRWASLLLLPVPISGLLATRRQYAGGIPQDVSRVALVVASIAQIIAAILFLLEIVGLAGERAFGIYLGAVVLLLLQASVYFVRLLVSSFQPPSVRKR